MNQQKGDAAIPEAGPLFLTIKSTSTALKKLYFLYLNL